MKREQKLQKQADQLTPDMPSGTRVSYRKGARDGPPRSGHIKGPFTVPGYNVVGRVDTHRACITASHIERA